MYRYYKSQDGAKRRGKAMLQGWMQRVNTQLVQENANR